MSIRKGSRRGTYTGARDDTVIDHVLGNEKMRTELDRLEVEDR